MKDIGWLRIKRDSNGSAVQMGLYTTTADFEPLAFVFGRTALRKDREKEDTAALAHALIASTVTEDVTLFGIVEEIPSNLYRDVRASYRIFRVLAASTDTDDIVIRNDSDIELTKIRSLLASDDALELENSFIEPIAGHDRPFEPLIRVEKAIDIAFEYPQIQNLVEYSGLRMVFNLLDRADAQNDRSGKTKSSAYRCSALRSYLLNHCSLK